MAVFNETDSDLETIEILDSFEFEKNAMKCTSYIFIGLILLGAITSLFYYSFPENLIRFIIIAPCVYLVYYLFEKMIRKTEQRRGFKISTTIIGIKLPSESHLKIASMKQI